jgi:murein tripeptide amidase MpaA
MHNLHKTILLLFFVLYFFPCNLFSQKVYSQEQQKYSRVRIYTARTSDFQKMQDAGLFTDGGIYKPGRYFETWLSEYEINLLKNSGVPYEVTIDDWDKYYKSLPKMTEAEMQAAMHQAYIKDNIVHSIYGTMGGFLKYSEVVARLDSMRLQYPNLISAKFSIGNTIENRTQWCVRVTHNPDAPTGRPEVLMHAVIHAREPEGMEAQIYYMYWLFENYNIDPIATFILNNREIYWIPIFNPDGYVYNETTNPNGGGQWRCNRHITTGSCGPVDLNRNFGIYQYWNSTNGGSSTDQCSGGSGTYRGTSPNSEIEVQNVENFVISRNFKTGLGGHTYGNDIFKPWSWSDPNPTPDDAIFNRFMSDMTIYNGYRTGTAFQVLGYYIRGGSDDWYYNDSGHTSGQHIFVLTPESGTDFWPSQTEIIPDAQDMLWPNQYISLVAGAWVNVVTAAFNQQTYNQGGSGNFKVVFSNKGISTASNVKVQCIPLNTNYITIPVQLYNKASMPAFSSDSTTFNFTIAANAPMNCGIPVLITVKQSDTSLVYSKTVYCLIGNGTLALADSAENGFTRWSAGGTPATWQVVTNAYHSSSHSFADNASNAYGNNANNWMVLTNPINTSTNPIVYLTYWQMYSTEIGFDYCYLETSNDNGTTWVTVRSWNGSNLTWTQQAFDLTSYANGSAQFKIRFRFQSDASTTSQGWHVDDIKLYTYCADIINSVGNIELTPAKYSLEQNYPNPFNPVTRINYSIAKQGPVKISVYDILGREVTVLVNEVKTPGFYSVDFNSTGLSSGMYFYKMESSAFTDTKKLMLIK